MEKPPSKSSSGDDLALIGNVTRIWRHLTFQNSFIWQKCEICRRQQRGNFWLYPVRPKMHSPPLLKEWEFCKNLPNFSTRDSLWLNHCYGAAASFFVASCVCCIFIDTFVVFLGDDCDTLARQFLKLEVIRMILIISRSWKGVIFIISIWSKGVMDRAGAEWRRLIRLAAGGRVALIHSGLRQTTSLQSLWKN